MLIGVSTRTLDRFRQIELAKAINFVRCTKEEGNVFYYRQVIMERLTKIGYADSDDIAEQILRTDGTLDETLFGETCRQIDNYLQLGQPTGYLPAVRKGSQLEPMIPLPEGLEVEIITDLACAPIYNLANKEYSLSVYRALGPLYTIDEEKLPEGLPGKVTNMTLNFPGKIYEDFTRECPIIIFPYQAEFGMYTIAQIPWNYLRAI